jgi:hypothetical protein
MTQEGIEVTISRRGEKCYSDYLRRLHIEAYRSASKQWYNHRQKYVTVERNFFEGSIQ